MCSGTFLDSSADPDGCDARRIRDTVWEAPLGPFRATRAQHEKACKTRGTINRGLLRRMVAANNEMAINLATIKADDRRHGKWRFVPGLSGRVPHESRVARCARSQLEICHDAELTMHLESVGVPMNSSTSVIKLEREARSGGPRASLRIIYKRLLEMILRCVAPEPSGDLDGLRTAAIEWQWGLPRPRILGRVVQVEAPMRITAKDHDGTTKCCNSCPGIDFHVLH